MAVANDVPRTPGVTFIPAMLNDRGGYESDFTITCVDDDAVSGRHRLSAQAVRDRDVIERASRSHGRPARCGDRRHADVRDAGGDGPAVARTDEPRVDGRFSTCESFPFGASREIDAGLRDSTCDAADLCRRTRLGVVRAGRIRGRCVRALDRRRARPRVGNAGYYAIESLRFEKGYRAWGRELTPDITPYEAGLAFAVKLDKAGDFRGPRHCSS